MVEIFIELCQILFIKKINFIYVCLYIYFIYFVYSKIYKFLQLTEISKCLKIWT